MSQRINLVEQHARESNIEINGIPEHKTENLYNTIEQLFQVINIPSSNEVLHVTRVAKLNQDSNRPRTVIAKLRSPRLRDEVLAAVNRFNKANSEDKLSSHHLGLGGPRLAVYVAEHLSPANKAIHASTRIKARELKYKFVWVRNGRIFVRKNDTSEAIFIRNLDSLSRMV